MPALPAPATHRFRRGSVPFPGPVPEPDRALEAADLAEGHYRSSTLILLGLICGNDTAVAQMDAVERRCATGGF